MFYFNNCLRREHARMFGIGAFYDLNTTGHQATKATNLRVDDKCIVATPASSQDGEVVFTWWLFSNEIIKPDDNGTPCRVFFGKRIKIER